MSSTGTKSGVQSLPPSGIYSLKWNNFSQHLATGLRQLFDEDDYTDVTLACDGQFIRAHKFLLSLCSPFFKKLFQANTSGRKNSDDTIVILNNVRFKDLENILRFIYNGEANVNNADLPNFLQTGELLQIEGLSGLGNNDQVPSKDEDKGPGDFSSTLPPLPRSTPLSTSIPLLAVAPVSPTVQTRYRPAAVGVGQRNANTVNVGSRQIKNPRLVRTQQLRTKTLIATRKVDESPYNTSFPEIDEVDPLGMADTDMQDPDTSADAEDANAIEEPESEMLISDLKNQPLEYYSPEPAHEQEMTFGDSAEDISTYEGYPIDEEHEEVSYTTSKSCQAAQNNGPGSHSRVAVAKSSTSSADADPNDAPGTFHDQSNPNPDIFDAVRSQHSSFFPSPKRTVLCVLCGRYFKNKNSLKTHRSTSHRNAYKLLKRRTGPGLVSVTPTRNWTTDDSSDNQ